MYSFQKTSTVFLLFFVLFSSSLVLEGEDIFSDLHTEWSFAYSLVSNTTIPFNITTTADYSKATLLPDYNLLNVSSTVFTVPFVSFPIVMIYNLPTAIGTMRFSLEVLNSIFNNATFAWNNDELLALNPDVTGGGSARITKLVVNQDPVNQPLFEAIFPTLAQGANGDWANLGFFGLTARPSYAAIASAVGTTANSFGFIPLPLAISYGVPGLQHADFAAVDPKNSNNFITVPDTAALTSKTTIKNGMMTITPVKDAHSWPFMNYGYLAYDTQGNGEETCNFDRGILRYLYWVMTHYDEYLDDTTIRQGFRNLDANTYKEIQKHLLGAKCDDTVLLQYTNISQKNRTNALFAVTVVFMACFMALIVICWVLNKNRRQIPTFVNHFLVLFGLTISFVSYILWWYAPSSTALCETRYWFLGMGYTCVVSAIYGYAFVIYFAHSKKEMSSMMISTRSLYLGYFVIIALELVILIIRTVVSQPKSEEIVVNALRWETIYSCTVKNDVVDLIQYIFFAVVSVGVCLVLYRFLSEKAVQDRVKWLLLALFSTMMIFVQLVIITQILDLSDNQLYVIVTSMFLFAEGNIVIAYFLPNIWSKFKDRSRSSGSGNTKTATVTHVEMHSQST